MNPPTIGHAKLVDAVKAQGGDPYIFLSQSQKPKTDPLAFADKLRYAKFFFPEVTIGNPEVKTIIQALQKIDALGYDNLVYVAGSDRVPAFEELINKYNGVEYNFKSIKVVSAGERDPDADGAEGMSASKMRAAAAAGDLESFKQGVPNQEVADEMYAAVRQGMGVKDEVPAESIAEDNNLNVIKSLVDPAAQQRMAQSQSAKRGGKEKALADLKNAHMFDDPISMVKTALNMGATPEEVAQNLSPKANLSNAPTSDQVASQRANDPYLQTNYSIEETIRKVKGGYRLYSKDGKKNLGTFDTRAGAEKHEREVQYFKHKGK